MLLVIRTVKHAVGDADSMASEFEKCLQELRQAILGFTVLRTESLVWRVVKDVQELGAYCASQVMPKHLIWSIST